AIAGLLSPPEKRAPRETPPKTPPNPEHAADTPPADEVTETAAEVATREASAQADADATAAAAVEGDEADPDADVITPPKYTVKVDGKDVEVDEDELKKGYSRTADYTRKAQALAAERKAFDEGEKAKVLAERQTYSQYLD